MRQSLVQRKDNADESCPQPAPRETRQKPTISDAIHSIEASTAVPKRLANGVGPRDDGIQKAQTKSSARETWRSNDPHDHPADGWILDLLLMFFGDRPTAESFFACFRRYSSKYSNLKRAGGDQMVAFRILVLLAFGGFSLPRIILLLLLYDNFWLRRSCAE
jgi:hypothetical protein